MPDPTSKPPADAPTGEGSAPSIETVAVSSDSGISASKGGSLSSKSPSLPPRASSTPPPVPAAGREDDDPLLGTVLLERVRIDRPIARGGMGKVYFGEQVAMRRPCAIKILDPRLMKGADVTDFARRFLLEASTCAKLTHPNVVTIFDYGETADGSCFIAMEYLEGRSLSEELKASGRVSPERAIHITLQAARALREAHALGVVHRDMKPGNVFLLRRDDDDDFVKVLDFGLVKETSDGHEHTQIGQIMGSPRYMAPEQVQGKPVDARTDVYSVGAMLYAMLAGRPPFERATDLATMMAHVSDAPRPFASVAPDVVLPLGLEAVVMRCLAKRPDDRYSSMGELVAALKLRPDGTLAASDSGPHSGAKLIPPVLQLDAQPQPTPRSAKLFVLGVGLVVAASLAVAILTRPGPPPPPPVLAAAPPRAPAPPPPAPPPSAAAAKPHATLHVETDPPGVKIKEEGNVVCDATPCDIAYTGQQADPAYEHLLTFLKADYRLERKIVRVGASPLVVKMTRAR